MAELLKPSAACPWMYISDTLIGEKEIAGSIHNETIVELTPHQEGDFTFACGMDMMKGKLVVERWDVLVR